MDQSLVAEQCIQINATAENIWDVMTNAEKIKVYLFGTTVSTDWKEGSAISFSGEYQGQQYHDKGHVIEHRPNRLLKYSYWSGFSGLEDHPDNYAMVTYKIEPNANGHFEFTWHQQGFSSEEGKCHTEEGLKAMLKQIKQLAEAS